MPRADADSSESKLMLITQCARENTSARFRSLAHLLNADFLAQCFRRLKKDRAAGVDNVSWHDYARHETENLENLVERLKRKRFRPLPARRVYIEKGGGKMRPLGIPAIENKIVEAGIARILGAIYEQDFSEQSFGFRPGRSCHDALKEVGRLAKYEPVNHLVEADIKGFFDNVPHDPLLDFLRIRITDGSLLHLIEKFLKAGYMENGRLTRTDAGTPQGGILSPMLANIYLHYVLDEWFETTVKLHTRGFCELVRYADDFVCLVRYVDDAKRIEEAIRNRFARYGLELHPEKSRRISFGKYEIGNAKREGRKPNTFDFLGFTHYCTTTLRGRFKVGRKTCRKRFATKLREINEWLRQVVRTRIQRWWPVLAAKMRGHYQYYGVSENTAGIRNFDFRVRRSLYKWINRRSQKRSMNWEEFTDYLTHYPLPRPRIVHDFYQRNRAACKPDGSIAW